jgi:uncharacterized protein YwgA
MNSQLAVLTLFLSALGRSSKIDSLDDRLLIQKSVYLGQLTGVDLGYRYSWYVRGPYCTNLTQDYYALAAVDDTEKQEYAKYSLATDVHERLKKAKPLFSVPKGLNLELHQWLELLASWHYLLEVSKVERSEARKILDSAKPHVSEFVDQAHQFLIRHGFLKR